jgi:hypothetical protein
VTASPGFTPPASEIVTVDPETETPVGVPCGARFWTTWKSLGLGTEVASSGWSYVRTSVAPVA